MNIIASPLANLRARAKTELVYPVVAPATRPAVAEATGFRKFTAGYIFRGTALTVPGSD